MPSHQLGTNGKEFPILRIAPAHIALLPLLPGAARDVLHLIRGCGLDGLAAMPPKDGWIIRPLAQVSKKDLLHYCEAQHLPKTP